MKTFRMLKVFHGTIDTNKESFYLMPYNVFGLILAYYVTLDLAKVTSKTDIIQVNLGFATL